MAFDKVTRFVLGVSFICIMLTLVAIGAQAGEQETLPTAQEISTGGAASGVNDDPAQNLIRSQLAAIKSRDGDLAWSMTGAKIHEKFATGKEFLSHLRLQLRPLYNHDGFTFLEQHRTPAGLIQKVRIEERDGEAATIIFRLSDEERTGWQIDSFAILEIEAEPI